MTSSPDRTLDVGLADEVVLEIDREVQKLLRARTARAQSYGPHFAALWELAAQHVSGGKLLRPRLLLGAFDALAGEGARGEDTRSTALELSAALEILHYSFLLHDDVIDEDLLRRGKPNLIGHLAELPDRRPHDAARSGPVPGDRLHWARSSGILVGDLMLTIAHQVFARARVPADRRIRLLDLLDATVTETVAGEYCDVSLAHGCVTPDLGLVLDTTGMKTAAYTFELPLRVASILAGADARIEQQLGSVGRHLGVAFQLQDDLLSAFGVSEEHGKDQFSDFRERKETVLIAYARMTNDWPSVEQLLSADEFTAEAGCLVQRLLVGCGARGFIESMIQDQIRAALTILSTDNGALPAEVSRFVLRYVDALEGRTS